MIPPISAIVLLIGALVFLIGTSSNFRDADTDTVKLVLIETIKDKCTIVRYDITIDTVTYTCPTGIEYTISGETQ